tara:strand:- start:222 stop:701 length:480 start_codon:yes stop_codon:yes gene_type:complete
MTINEQDNFPDVTFFHITESGPVALEAHKILKNKKVLLVGVPGAFTPTCSDEHLPGYKKLASDFFSRGIEEIYVVSANDPFIMKSWSNSLDISELKFISDGNGEFRGKSGLETDLSVVGLGLRLSRFAMIIDNGKIIKIFNDNGPGLELSKAENVIKSI